TARMKQAGIAVYTVDQQDRDTDGLLSRDTLTQMSTQTGGLWIPTDRTEAAISQAFSDERATYRIAYYAPLGNFDGRVHPLRITTSRKGVHIRAVDQYFADPNEATPDGRFAIAALGPADATAIGIRATIDPSDRVASWIHFRVRVDASDL